MSKSTKYDRKLAQINFMRNCVKRVKLTNSNCQVCGRKIQFPTAINFDHIITRSKCSKWQYENYFLFVCENLHKYRTEYNQNLKSDPCVSFFLREYERETKNFYSGFLKGKSKNELHIIL